MICKFCGHASSHVSSCAWSTVYEWLFYEYVFAVFQGSLREFVVVQTGVTTADPYQCSPISITPLGRL